MSTIFTSRDHVRTARARKVGEQMAATRSEPKIVMRDGHGREMTASVAQFGAVCVMAALNYYPRQVSQLEADRASYRRFLAKRAAATNGEPVKPKKKRVSRKKAVDATI